MLTLFAAKGGMTEDFGRVVARLPSPIRGRGVGPDGRRPLRSRPGVETRPPIPFSGAPTLEQNRRAGAEVRGTCTETSSALAPDVLRGVEGVARYEDAGDAASEVAVPRVAAKEVHQHPAAQGVEAGPGNTEP